MKESPLQLLQTVKEDEACNSRGAQLSESGVSLNFLHCVFLISVNHGSHCVLDIHSW